MSATCPVAGLALQAKRPSYELLKISHRGFATMKSPSCSLAAFRTAIDRGYDMVELDVRESRDGVPFVHHDRNCEKSCSLRREFSDLASSEISRLRYSGTEERVAILEEVLALCRGKVGIMLDIKDVAGSDRFFMSIRNLVESYGFTRSSVTISNRFQKVAQYLDGAVMFRLEISEFLRLRESGKPLPGGRFAFSHQRRLTDDLILLLREAKVPVIATIIPGQYPHDMRIERGSAEIRRLKRAGIQGILFDSIYHEAVFEQPPGH